MKGLRTAVVLLAACPLAGCGYRMGLGVPPEEGRTIGIEFFDNRTPERDIERELHEELSRAALDLVDANLVAPNRSDLVVRGTILTYQRRGGIRSDENQLLETGVRIDVTGTLWRRRRPDDPPPAEEKESAPEERSSRLGYDHRRGVTYERDFYRAPSIGHAPDPDWIQVGRARAGSHVSFVLGERGSEDVARTRALHNIAERLVLDLFSGVN